MNDFWTRLDQVRADNDVLKHPFYVRWTRGELTREELATYAGQYRHAVVAIAKASDRAAGFEGSDSDTPLRRHADEERSHVELWGRFAAAVGGGLDHEPAPETAACAEAWTSGDCLLDHLVALYAIEAAQPEISEVKRDGLVRHYGFEPGRATAYFDVHADLDRRHAAEDRELIAERLDGADQKALIRRAEVALRANWVLLDGVERLGAG